MVSSGFDLLSSLYILYHLSYLRLLTLLRLGGQTAPHWFILPYNFLITYPDFVKLGDFFKNLSRINILNFFFSRFDLVFAVLALLHDMVLFFLLSLVRKMNISLTILVIFVSRMFRKKIYWLF